MTRRLAPVGAALTDVRRHLARAGAGLASRRRQLRRVGTAAVLVAAGLLVAALATGELVLVTTHGISMLPRFHTGDLAVVVPSGAYHVGEVVAYRSPVIHGLVLHRIVAEHHGRFTFKGDNNDFLDPVRLPAGAVAGRLLLRIPQGGYVLAWIKSPLGIGCIGVALVALTMAADTGRRRRHGGLPLGPAVGADPLAIGQQLRRLAVRRTHPGPLGEAAVPPAAPAPVAAGRAPRSADVPVDWWLVAAPAVVVALALLLASACFSRPVTVASRTAVPFTQDVSFSYSATVPAGVTYPSGSLTTGDPVFRSLVDVLDVTATYHLRARAALAAVAGSITATASLVGPGGWMATLGTAGPSPFAGATAAITVPVDLAAVTADSQAFTKQTGEPFVAPEIVVTPTVDVGGTVDGVHLAATTAPAFDLVSQGQVLEPVSSDAGGTTSLTQLQSTVRGTVERPTAVPGSVDLLGRRLTVAGGRRLALVLLALALAALGGGVVWVRRRMAMDEPARIRARYGGDLVSVVTSPAPAGVVAVDVDSFSALVLLAERYDGVILEHQGAGGCTYYVEAGSYLYRFTGTSAAGRRRDERIWEDLRRVGVVPPAARHARRVPA